MTDTLLPCPFCGSDAKVIRTDKDRRPYDWRYVVQCVECHAEGQYDLGESGAIETWNTRPLESALRAQLSEITERVPGIVRALEVWHNKCAASEPLDPAELIQALEWALSELTYVSEVGDAKQDIN
jgi:Lar family restriction alleviation protein